MAVWKDTKTKRWAAKFQYRRRQYKKEGFRTKSEALLWRERKVQELKNPPQHKVIALSFFQVATKYLEDCEARYQKNTWRQKAFVYRNFLFSIDDDQLIDSIPKQKFIGYLKNRKNKGGNCAANRDLKEFKALYNWRIRQEILKKNPCANIEKYPENKKERYVPPAEDLNEVLQVAECEDADLVQIICHTAGRISEIFNMTWEDVNFEKRWVRLWTRKRKGGELQEDRLPMTSTLHDILKRRWNHRDENVPYVFHNPDGSKFTKNQKKDTMKNLCRKAGVKSFGFHAIRHHVASSLADSGEVSLSQIQKILRHKRVSTTDNYIKTLDPQLKQTAKTLEELLNGRRN